MQFSSFAMRKAALPVLALALSGSGALVACGDDDEPSPGDDGGAGGKGSGGRGSGGDGAGGNGSGGKGSGGKVTGDGGPAFSAEIVFDAVVGNRPFDCSAKYPGLGTSKAELAPVDFRFYVHDVRLVFENGNEEPARIVSDGKWQSDSVALLDFENNQGTCENGTPDVRKHIEVQGPSGAFKGIAFRIGIPESLNHANPVAAPSPLNLTALHWSWNFGYKFAKIDFKLVTGDGGMVMPEGGMHGDGGMVMPEGGMHGDGGMVIPPGHGGMNHGAPGAVLLHLGSVGCNAADAGTASCSIKNRPDIRFAEFDPATQKIVLDYAKLIENIDPAKDKGGAGACMGDPTDPECVQIFDALGLELTGEPKAEHPAFSVADR